MFVFKSIHIAKIVKYKKTLQKKIILDKKIQI